ncbi:MAG: hypothetical protein JNN01_09380 [Opitutaceae bacterium]|nr:hypothetical protein [Opitutaceae bacterium]
MSSPNPLPLFHVVGFTGHRNLANPALIAASLESALRSLKEDGTGEWIALSSIAAGGDVLFTRQALALKLAWHCVLPLPAAEFRKDFSEADWKTVESLLPQAEQVRVIAENGEREDAYLDAGMETVHACDVLLAVWDGEAARGKGGTADVIAYARDLKKPLLIIDATSGALRREQFDAFTSRDHELDFLNSLPAAPESAYAAANPFEAPAVVFQFQKAADHAATQSAPHFRRLIGSTVLLHVAATLVAAAALAFSLHIAILPWIKLVCVVGALLVALAIRHYRAQHNWVRCRLAAELGRSSLATWGLPRAAAMFENLELPEIRQLARTLQTLHRRAANARPVPMSVFKERYLADRIDDQLGYYQRRLSQALPQLARLRFGFAAATLLAIVCTAAYAIDHTWHLAWFPAVGEQWFYYFLPISLPVVAAAFMSFISINDLHRRVARYREMRHVLERARIQIGVSQTWNSLEKIVARTEHALLQEVLEWHTLTSHLESH